MRTTSLLGVLVLVLTACAGTPPSQQEVEKFVREYVGQTDTAKVMALVSQEPTISSISVGRIHHGWKAIRAAYDEASTPGDELKVKVGSIDVTPIAPDTVLAIAPIKVSPFVVRGRTIVVDAPGAMTIILKRTPEGLRVIHEHYSLQPI